MADQHTLRFEWLEHRLMLAGDVSVELIDGNLDIDGNKLDNVIEIRQIDTDSFEIAGVGTQVNGAASFVANNVRGDFVIGLGAGNDTVRFIGALDIPAKLTLKAGNGNDLIESDNMRVRADALFNFGRGNDEVRVIESTFDGRAEFWFKHGDDLAHIEGSSVADFFEFDMGEDDDTVEVIMSTFKGESKIDSSDGQDVVNVDGATMEGLHQFVSKGIGQRSYDIANSTFRRDTVFTSGDGDEAIQIASSRFDQKLQCRLDAGSDQIQLQNSIFGGSVALDGDDGNDSVIYKNGGNTFNVGQPNLQHFENVL